MNEHRRRDDHGHAEVPGAEPGVTGHGRAGRTPTTEIVLTAAELVYLSVPSWDDSRTYVVPGYRLAADDGTGTTASARGDRGPAPAARRPAATDRRRPALHRLT